MDQPSLHLADVATQAFIGLVAAAIAVISYHNARRAARLEATLRYEDRWFEINRLLIQDPAFRDAMIRLNPTGSPMTPDARVLFLLLSQGVAAFHLHDSGAMGRRFYEDQLTLIVRLLGEALNANWASVQSAGYPLKFLNDLDTKRSSVRLVTNA